MQIVLLIIAILLIIIMSILAIIMDMSLVWIPHPWRLRRK